MKRQEHLTQAAAISDQQHKDLVNAQKIFNEAFLHHQAGQLPQAEHLYRKILAITPRHADAMHMLGVVAYQVGQNDAAAKLISGAIEINGAAAPYYSNLGLALKNLGRLDEAIAAYRTAIRIQPDIADAHTHLGLALKELGRLDEAVAACNTAIRIKPDFAGAYCNLGITLRELGRLDEAIAAYSTAIRIKPDYAHAHYNESLVRLLLGDFDLGWQKYEWRWRGGVKEMKARNFAQPRWEGQDLAGRTILLHAEQGLGDTIQFCRYASLVAARGGRVVLEAQRSLLQLLSGLKGVDRLVAAGDRLPAFDLHCPLLSLPGVFGTKREAIPAELPYLFGQDEAQARWKQRLGPSGFKIGIGWQGNPNAEIDRGRSAPLSCFAPLANLAGVRLISLQKIHGLEQLKQLPPGMQVETLGDDFDAGPHAFVDTAAVMMNLDLIITTDTSLAHLAGALDKPAWVPLQFTPDWRWLMTQEDSPWYPHTRLFRQAERGEWEAVFGRMTQALTTELERWREQ